MKLDITPEQVLKFVQMLGGIEPILEDIADQTDSVPYRTWLRTMAEDAKELRGLITTAHNEEMK